MQQYNAGYQDLKWCDNNRKRDVLAAIWYPTMRAPLPVTYLAHFKSRAAQNTAPAVGQFPMVFISHGSQGHRYNQYYLAEYLAQSGYVVISVEHAHDTAFDDDLTYKDENHEHRLIDVLYVLQELSTDPVFDVMIDWNNIAHVGHSFGGFTSYMLSGGSSHLIDSTLTSKISNALNDALKCIIMLAPALSEHVHSVSSVDKPAFLMTADEDEMLQHSSFDYLKYLTNVKHINLQKTGHYVFLMECPEPVADQCPEIAFDSGVPRATIHPLINQEVTAFLNQHLLSQQEATCAH